MTITCAKDTEYFGGRAGLVTLKRHSDDRGTLSSFDFNHMPFKPCRVFTITESMSATERGGHGHNAGQQMLVCLHGRIEVLMRADGEDVSVTLEPGPTALVFGPGVWCKQTYLIADSVLLVFASEPYDPSSYILDSE